MDRTQPTRLHLLYPPNRVVEDDTPSTYALVVQPHLLTNVLEYRPITSLRLCLRLRYLLVDVVRVHPVRRRVAYLFPSVIWALATVDCIRKRYHYDPVKRANLAMAHSRLHVPS
jgi:hypothetical protein